MLGINGLSHQSECAVQPFGVNQQLLDDGGVAPLLHGGTAGGAFHVQGQQTAAREGTQLFLQTGQMLVGHVVIIGQKFLAPGVVDCGIHRQRGLPVQRFTGTHRVLLNGEKFRKTELGIKSM